MAKEKYVEVEGSMQPPKDVPDKITAEDVKKAKAKKSKDELREWLEK